MDVPQIIAGRFRLNRRQARYVVVGGFAMAAIGYNRRTMDVDLLIDTSTDNETRVLEAVATLPDGAARQIEERGGGVRRQGENGSADHRDHRAASRHGVPSALHAAAGYGRAVDRGNPYPVVDAALLATRRAAFRAGRDDAVPAHIQSH